MLQEEAKAEEEEGVPDEEGWVKVTRRGRRPVLPRTEAASLRVLERERRKRARKELLNFYAWQHRETKMERKGVPGTRGFWLPPRLVAIAVSPARADLGTGWGCPWAQTSQKALGFVSPPGSILVRRQLCGPGLLRGRRGTRDGEPFPAAWSPGLQDGFPEGPGGVPALASAKGPVQPQALLPAVLFRPHPRLPLPALVLLGHPTAALSLPPSGSGPR